MEDVTEQASVVYSFTKYRGLHPCLEKCALLPSSNRLTPLSLDVNNEVSLPVEKSVSWCVVGNYFPLEQNVCKQKLHACFFAHSQLGAFHGLLNPLSSRSIIESCILPVLLYGSEMWVLNSSLLNLLESFQAELGRHIPSSHPTLSHCWY